MPEKDQMARNVSSKILQDTNWLYSVDSTLSDKDLKKVEEVVTNISEDPIYIVDVTGTVEQIYSTIIDFINLRKLKENNRGLIVTLDHTLLTKGKGTDNEKAIIDDLSKMFVELKKECIHNDVKILIIMLSQLNRDIESKERTTNPLLHYPTKNDLFAASSVYYCSDYVLISHKPALVNGITHHYGPPRGVKYPKGLPVFNPQNPDQPMVYWHLIKNRFGEPKVLMMLDNFKHSRIDEYMGDISTDSSSATATVRKNSNQIEDVTGAS
jgi:hypothetical protein